MKVNLPNKLTLLRIALIPLILILMIEIPAWPAQAAFVQTVLCRILALIVFCLASVTDFFDGQIARKRNLVTNFGKFTDPLADKMLVLSVFLAFVANGRIHALIFFVILARELIITGLRQVALEQNFVMSASWWGKAKTTIQMFALIALMIEGIVIAKSSTHAAGSIYTTVANILVALALILTIISAVDYFRKNAGLLKDTTA
ncbi:MAG: CDP-diacylglycerol--glycerol-3-phosphate 3-phosphatidyltransferase [Eubacteriales bacterium]|nr:CDP-diacylglycerol--glycerol-3-phosphate 3-phosphatidyltransferase [Eubacteriales bacterium]